MSSARFSGTLCLDRGIIHTDISPNNIMHSEAIDGYKFIDFGESLNQATKMVIAIVKHQNIFTGKPINCPVLCC
jgi:Ser/Thr protein kinase RdoA (MazF antagonist)